MTEGNGTSTGVRVNERLVYEANTDPTFQKVMKFFADRSNNSTRTILDRLSVQTKIDRDDLKAVMEKLQNYGIGQLIKDSGKIVFVWKYRLNTVGQTALGMLSSIQPMFIDASTIQKAPEVSEETISFKIPEGISKGAAKALFQTITNSIK